MASSGRAILRSGEKRKELARRAGRSAACAGFKYSAAPRANTLGYAEEQANTLTADWHAPAVLPLPNTALSQYGTEIAGCLTARGDSSPCADRGQNIVCMTGTQAHCHISNEIAGCLTAHMGKDDAPVVVDGTNLQTYVCETAHSGSNGLGVGADGDPAFTPLANHPHMVAAGSGSEPIAMGDLIAHTAICHNVCPTLKCGGDGAMVASETAGKIMEANPMLVRRLTPLECERLQGFPDGHTLIGWKGKPAEECPDGPRYKAIGNSMAVPVMRWIGERIAAVDGH